MPRIASRRAYFVVLLAVLRLDGIVEATLNTSLSKNGTRSSKECAIVTDSILFRKKLGFPVPIRVWLKDELYDWAKNLIRESNTEEWINKSYVNKLLEDHLHDKRDNSRKIWTVLVFMLWHSIYVENAIQFSNGYTTV